MAWGPGEVSGPFSVPSSDRSFVASYVYDYRGLRVGKTTPSGTTTHLWDPQGNLYRESGPNGVREYFWDGNGGLARVDCTPQGGQKTILYSHLNARGDVLSLWDDTLAHNVFATYRYEPWGEILSAEGSMAGQPIRCAGYYYDEETGLYYLKGRYYSPQLGRFLTKDPALRQPNYVYAADNPLGNTDPSGCGTWICRRRRSLELPRFGGQPKARTQPSVTPLVR